MADRDTYWASVETSDLADAVSERANDYYHFLDESGQLRVWQMGTRCYYGLDADGGWKRSQAIGFGGEQGEVVGYRVNGFGSLVRYIYTLVTASRPVLKAKATNDDPDTQEQTILGDGLLEWYWRSKRIEDSLLQSCLWSLYQGEGWHLQYWDVFRGRRLGEDPETGAPIYAGDVRAVPLRGIDVIRDPDAVIGGDERPQWYVARVPMNRHDLAAMYPDAVDAILNLESVTDTDQRHRMFSNRVTGKTGDRVYLHMLFHEKTPAMPSGRHAFLAGEEVLFDGPLPYEEAPLYEMMPAVQDGAPFGHSHMWDCMAPQAQLDAAVSTMATNFDAFGIVNIGVPEGGDFAVEEVAGGLRFIHYNANTGARPEAINLLPASKEGVSLAEFSRKSMELISGVNETARGAASSDQKSGSHAALLQAMSVQANSAVQASYVRAVERAGNGLLRMLQTFVTDERKAEIAGRDKTPRLQFWTGEDLNRLDGVTVEVVSAVHQTVAGRRDTADKWFEQGIIKTPDEYETFIATGRLETVYEDARDEYRVIEAENELLREGTRVPALVTDRHTVHIRGHRAELNDPRIRLDPGLRVAVLEHIEEHIRMRHTTDPEILAAVGEPPPVAPMGMLPGPGGEPPPGGPGGPPSAGPPGGALPEQPAVIPALEGQEQGGEIPNLPMMPVANPAGPMEGA